VGPYRQSERIDIYKRVAKQLLESGDAYPCFCSEAELEEKRKQVRGTCDVIWGCVCVSVVRLDRLLL